MGHPSGTAIHRPAGGQPHRSLQRLGWHQDAQPPWKRPIKAGADMSIGQSMLFLLELLPLQLRRSCDYSSFPRRLLAGPGHCWAIEVPLPWQMDQTVCRMHTEPSWVLSLRFPFFPCSPMSKAQRQSKGLHLGSVTAPTQRENSNKVKKGKTEGKNNQTR